MPTFVPSPVYRDDQGRPQPIYLSRTEAGVPVVKACCVTTALGLTHLRTLAALTRLNPSLLLGAVFIGSGMTIRCLGLDGFRAVAARAEMTPNNASFLRWCESEIIPFLHDYGASGMLAATAPEPPPPPLQMAVVEPEPLPEPEPEPEPRKISGICQTYYFQDNSVRVILTPEGEPWWILTDLGRALGYRDGEKAKRLLRPDQRGTLSVGIPEMGLLQGMILASESGLYRFLMRSERPDAQPFQDWVTDEVLTSIRKTGHYFAPGPSLPGNGDVLGSTIANTAANAAAVQALYHKQAATERDVKEIRSGQVQLGHEVEKANARAANAEARAANAEVKAAESEARSREYERSIAEANATASRSRVDSLHAISKSDEAIRLQTGHTNWHQLVIWAETRGVYLSQARRSQEGKVVTALCLSDGIQPYKVRSMTYPDGVNAYPEKYLEYWLEGYWLRHPDHPRRPGGPTLFDSSSG